MSQIITLQCDVCSATKDVETVVITRTSSKSVEIDLCPACYRKGLAPILSKVRPTAKTAGRPQVKFKVTELPPQPGG